MRYTVLLLFSATLAAQVPFAKITVLDTNGGEGGQYCPGGGAATITAASNATPIVVTAANTFSSNDQISISGVAGNTAANGVWLITAVSGTGFTLVGSVGNGTWTSGGVATRVTCYSTEEIYVANGKSDGTTTLVQWAIAQQGNWNATRTVIAVPNFSGLTSDTSCGNARISSNGYIIFDCQHAGTQINVNFKALLPNAGIYYDWYACKVSGSILSFVPTTTNCTQVLLITAASISGNTGEGFLDAASCGPNSIPGGGGCGTSTTEELTVSHRNPPGQTYSGGYVFYAWEHLTIDYSGTKPSITTTVRDIGCPATNCQSQTLPNATPISDGCPVWFKGGGDSIIANGDGTWTVYVQSNQTVSGDWSGTRSYLGQCGLDGMTLGQTGVFTFQESATGVASGWTQLYPVAGNTLLTPAGTPWIYSEFTNAVTLPNGNRGIVFITAQTAAAPVQDYITGPPANINKANFASNVSLFDTKTGALYVLADCWTPGGICMSNFTAGGTLDGMWVGGTARPSGATGGTCKLTYQTNINTASGINKTLLWCLDYPGSPAVYNATSGSGSIMGSGVVIN